MDQEVEKSICDMRARLYAQQIALRALARSHPDPVELLATWRAALIEAAKRNPVVPADARNNEYIAGQIRIYSEEWTAEFVNLAVPAPGSLPA